MHKEREAYADFRMALNENVINLPIHSHQINHFRFNLNAKETSSPLDNFITSLNSELIYKTSPHSQMTLNEKSLLQKIGQIHFDSFGQGLAAGLLDGGVEILQELGPFFANLLFHPIKTSEELLTAIRFLVEKALEEEWETVFEALAPELKELFSTWDKIKDYHKGRLTGLFIGKNGVTALTALGATKTLCKLKNVVIGSKSAKFSCLLNKVKSEFITTPAIEPFFPPVLQSKKWQLAYSEGVIIESNFYHERALGQITSNVDHHKFILEAKTIKNTPELESLLTTWKEIEKGSVIEQGQVLSNVPQEILPSVAKVEIVNTSATFGKIEAILSEQENIVTALYTTEVNKVFVRNLNSKKHIMQPKHAWDKLIELTGNLEVDCNNVIKLLEDNQIFLEKNRLEPVKKLKKIIRYDHQMKINGHEIRAVFNQDIETGKIFLNDAWVITK